MDPDLALFADVVDAGSLAAAARVRGLSPAMMSKRIARLEARLGVRLLHRTTRRLAATETGARLHADLVPVLAALKAAEARASGAAAEAAGPLRVSAPTSFGRLHIAPALHRFLAEYPRVELTLDLSDGFTDLIGQRIDVAVRITDSVPAALHATRLATSRRILCAAPAYLDVAGAPRTLADLAAHRLLAAQGQLPWRLTNGRATRAIDGASLVATNSSELVRELALTGVGIALRSLWDVAPALRDGALVRVLPEWEGSRDVGIFAARPDAPAPPAAAIAFTAFLVELFANPAWDAG